MARKRHSDEEILKILREIELHLASGADVPMACRSAGISDATTLSINMRVARQPPQLFVGCRIN